MSSPKLEGTAKKMVFEFMFAKMKNDRFAKNAANKKKTFLTFLVMSRRQRLLIQHHLKYARVTFQKTKLRLELAQFKSYNLAVRLNFTTALCVLKLTCPREICLEINRDFEISLLSQFLPCLKNFSRLQIYHTDALIVPLIEQNFANLKSLRSTLDVLSLQDVPPLKLDRFNVDDWKSRASREFSLFLRHEIKHIDLSRFGNAVLKCEFGPSEIDTNNTTERISLHLTDISFVGDLYPVVEIFFQKFKALKTLDIDLELFEKTSKGRRFARQLIGIHDDLMEFAWMCSGHLQKVHINFQDFTFLKKHSDLQRFLQTIKQSEQFKNATFGIDPLCLSSTVMHFKKQEEILELSIRVAVVYIEGNPQHCDFSILNRHSTDESDVDF